MKTTEAPYQAHSKTSKDAADAVAAQLGKRERELFVFLRENGPTTDQGMQLALKWEGSYQRPARVALTKRGLVGDSGNVAKTLSGRCAVLWQATMS